MNETEKTVLLAMADGLEQSAKTDWETSNEIDDFALWGRSMAAVIDCAAIMLRKMAEAPVGEDVAIKAVKALAKVVGGRAEIAVMDVVGETKSCRTLEV